MANLNMFWHLEAEVSAIERGTGKGAGEPDFYDVHDLAKHCIQSLEIAEAAIGVLSLVRKEHERVIGGNYRQRVEVELDSNMNWFCLGGLWVSM